MFRRREIYFLIILFALSRSLSYSASEFNTQSDLSETYKEQIKPTEKVIEETKKNLQNVQKEIARILDRKNYLEKEEKEKTKVLKEMEKNFINSSNEYRRTNYDIKYAHDFIRNFEKDLEQKKSEIEGLKLRLNAQLSELLLLSLRKTDEAPLSFLDDSDKYREELRRVCQEGVEILRSQIKVYEQLSSQLSDLNDYRLKVYVNLQKVEGEKVKAEKEISNSRVILNKINKSKKKIESDLAVLSEREAQIKGMIRSLLRKKEIAEKKIKSTDVKFNGQGNCPWPLKGKILRNFSLDKSSGIFNPGIDIESPQGTKVVSIAPGSVLFADWFKGYGNLIIIEHEKNFCSLYAYLQEIWVKTGQTVDTNTPLGSSGVIETLDEPGLHFEVRKDGESINPGLILQQEP